MTSAGASREILGLRVDATSYERATQAILEWARAGVRGYVCAANVHMVMEAHDSPEFQRVVNAALLVTPDGVPLVWALRSLDVAEAERVYGPTLMLHLCAAAASAGVKIALVGGDPETLEALRAWLIRRFASLEVAFAASPPFRVMSAQENRDLLEGLVASDARLVFVGLGCPKQERWMAEHTAEVPAVLVGIGAAFDFHAGRVRQAPGWMQERGLEWLFRLAMEPRRLWRRYALHNPRFVALFGAQWLRSVSRREAR